MPQEEIRHIRIFLRRFPVQVADIAHDTLVALRLCEVSVRALVNDGFTVPEMIVSDHVKSRFRHKPRKAVIAVNEFDHTVDDLQNAADLSLRDPFDRVYAGCTVTGHVYKFIFCHACSSPQGFSFSCALLYFLTLLPAVLIAVYTRSRLIFWKFFS